MTRGVPGGAKAILAAALFAGLAGFSTASADTVNATPENLSAILKSVKPGDVVLLADGVYKGGFALRRSGAKGAPIVIKAAGEACVFDGGENALLVEGASWVRVEGIRFQHARRAGVFVRAPPDDPATNVTVRDCVFADNGTWGLITGHVHHFTVEDCEAYGSKIQHGIYVANSGDHPVVRNNRIHHNNMCGLHMNGDPECGGDGVISNALVEGNRIYENGKKGGSGINLTHVQDSLYRNNLLYNNYAGGIVTYYDTGGEKCASKRNKIVNNTVYFRPGQGRWALSLKKSSTGAFVKNNILVGGIYGAVEVEPSSLPGLVMDNNVIANHPGQQFNGDSSEGIAVTVDQWRKRGFDVNSSIGAMPKFVDTEAGDLKLSAGSAGIDAGAALGELVPLDIEGVPRPQGRAFDCGCREMQSQQ